MAKILIRTDGSCRPNPGEMGIGIIIYKDGKKYKEISESIGYGTNNIAEYQAVIRALKEVEELETEEILIYSDSRLIVNQVNGRYKVKNENIKPLFIKLKEMIRESQVRIIISWIGREENGRADILARDAI